MMARSIEIPLVLFRSATTEWDAARRLQGNTDLPMGGEGPERLRAQLETLNGQKLTGILTAPDEASRATAAALSDRYGGVKVATAKDLAEIDLGLWQGRLEDEVTNCFAKSFAQWQEDPTGVTAPEGESIEEASGRILGAFAKGVLKLSKGPVAVVLRPHSMAVVRCWMTGEPLSRFWAVDEEMGPIERTTVARARLKELS